jgi:hypothetical protein
MRSISHALVLVMFLVGGALAQPGAEPAPDPSPYPPPPAEPPPHQPYPAQPPPPPGYAPGYAPPAHQYIPVQLSIDDQRLLAQGEISDGQHVAGAALAIFFGFGVGQAVQGRWSETGWIFAVGEAASIAAIIVGLVRMVDDCFGSDRSCNNSDGEILFVGGLISFSVLRIWEIVDSIAGPPKHNQRVRDLRMRLGMPMPIYTRVMPYVAPARDGGGGVAGLTLRF